MPAPSPARALLLCAARLGLTLDARGRWRAGAHRPRAESTAIRLACLAAPGTITLITGPSGAGKSTLLRAAAGLLARQAGARLIRPRPRRGSARVACLLPGPPGRGLALLARVGLAEARVVLGRINQLSDGQADRLAVALALQTAERAAGPATLVLDEFTSRLDRLSARGLCAALHRAVKHLPSLRVVAATALDDAPDLLKPHVHVHLTLTGSPRFTLARRTARGAGAGPCG